MTRAMVAFAATAALLVLLPGPDTLVVVRSLLRAGRRGGITSAAGVVAGLAIWVAIAAAGLSAMLQATKVGYDALRVAGACYLLWLGVQSFRSRTAATADESSRRSLLGTGFGAGLATDLLNPKVGVLFVSLLPGFVPHGASVGLTSLALGGIFIVETMVYFAVLVLVAGRIVTWMTDPRMRKRIDRAAGLVFFGFAARLAAGE